MPELYDVAIIGTGPAGLSAALTAKARNMKYIWFGNKELSQKVELAEKISNYPGLIGVSGKEMQAVFQKQMEEEGLAVTEKVINQIFSMGKQYALFCGQESWMAKTIVLAMGMAPSTTMKNEVEFLGKGVSYCATCDGRLYTGKNIAVYCTNPEFESEVEFLADLAEKVYVFATYKGFGIKRENITVLNAAPDEVMGDSFVTGIKLKKQEGENEGRLIEVDGIFCLKDSYSPISLVKGLEMEENHIKVNRRQETNLLGCYAAGDCTGRPYQYTKAVGEGNVAIHSVLDYLRD